jgi:putative ABC transport system permease protein
MLKRRDMKVSYAAIIEDESTLAEAVSPWSGTDRSVKFESNTLTRTPIFGVDEDYFVTNSVEVEYGRFLSDDDCQRNRKVCVLGNGIYRKLFDKIPPIGQTIDIGGRNFQVIGVNAKMGKFFGQDMDNFVMIPVGAWQKAFGRHEDLDIVVKARDANEIEDLKWELRGIMRRVRGLGPTDPDDFGINAQSMVVDWFNTITAGVYTGGILIALISLLVGGIGIMNIMLVSVTERTPEIGLRKALGAHRWMIAWQFLIESSVICCIGGILGIVFAVLVSYAVDQFIQTVIPLWVILFGLAFSTFVGMVFGIYPALKAARLSPIDALRQE